jgi:hypothetical protein
VKPTPPTPEEVSRALELLRPEKLLMAREDLADLDDELKTELHDRLCRTVFPVNWASRLQLILLLLHDAHRVDPARFVAQVFLPWVRLRRTLQPNLQRVGREMARIGEVTEGSVEETEHQIALYRLIVSDLFDPYITILVASCELIAGTFTDLDAANFKMGELNKVEFVEAHLRRRGDTVQLFRGYDSRVRNAISHAGSHGCVIEGRTVLFRNINRGPQPKVSPVRWSVDELGWNCVLVAELVSCLDAATELFGLDCVRPDIGDYSLLLQVVDAAFTPAQRTELRSKLNENLTPIWTDQALHDERRGEVLSEILAEQFRLRDMALCCIDLSMGSGTVLIAIPPKGAVDDEQSLRGRLLEMTRYLIVARSVFGPCGERIAVVETDEKVEQSRLMATIPRPMLDAYAEEKAGLIDLLREGQFNLGHDRLYVVIDDKALAEFEDQSLGRRFPRKDRAGAETPP